MATWYISVQQIPQVVPMFTLYRIALRRADTLKTELSRRYIVIEHLSDMWLSILEIGRPSFRYWNRAEEITVLVGKQKPNPVWMVFVPV